MDSKFVFYLHQFRERLWAKPLIYCIISVLAAFVALLPDHWYSGELIPTIAPDTIETLLTIISASMLAVATFAVASMLSAYGSASAAATPRAFKLVLSDDVSQTALSSFIGSFIFSIVSIVALKSGLYDRGGLFTLFVITLAIFAWVVLTFVRWVDNIARLGRLGTTISKAEAVAQDSLDKRRKMPFLGGVEKTEENSCTGAQIYSEKIGYVQHIDMAALQRIGDRHDARIMINAMPGSFLAPGRPLVTLSFASPLDDELKERIERAFVIGEDRTFEADPRFGLIVLSEIAARALSPAINDSGTAILIIGRFVRLFANWTKPLPEEEILNETYDRVLVPSLRLSDMFDDAFTAIARDGAGAVEVGIRLQKAFASLASVDNDGLRHEAIRHSGLAIERARTSLTLPQDLAHLENLRLKGPSKQH